MGVVTVKTNSTADGRSVFDVKKEERAIECLRATRNGMNHARAAVDRFIANPKDVIVRQKKGHLFPDALILSEPFEDPLILCQRGIVILPSKDIFWAPNLRVVAQNRSPFLKKRAGINITLSFPLWRL